MMPPTWNIKTTLIQVMYREDIEGFGGFIIMKSTLTLYEEL